VLFLFIILILVGYVAAQDDAVTPGVASTQAGGDTWITVTSPFSGDTNGNDYTVYEYSLTNSGPWTTVCGNGIPGESAWRHCAFGGLIPDTDYFMRVTFSGTEPAGLYEIGGRLQNPLNGDHLSMDIKTFNFTPAP
jgi:hypothetical protein